MQRTGLLTFICIVMLPTFSFAGLSRQVLTEDQQYEVSCFDAIVAHSALHSTSHQSFSGFYDLKKNAPFVVQISEGGQVNVYSDKGTVNVNERACQSSSSDRSSSQFLASAVDADAKKVLNPTNIAPEDRNGQILVRKAHFKKMYDKCRLTKDPDIQRSISKAGSEMRFGAKSSTETPSHTRR